jgi:exodeoxyribonuclease-1
MDTFFWHDYETFGRNPAWDRAAQFAGIRTDKDLNIIGKPIVKYCKFPNDCLPQPGACLVTGITPQIVAQKGVSEAKFAEYINNELSQPGTCSVGYNNISFDDEFTRNILYRNFYDPFEYLQVEGNSRWDLIDVVRLVRALRPEGINWPEKEGGGFSTKLEDLTKANGIEHNAHDALADVRATIEIAKLIKSKHPKLFDYAFENRTKEAILKLLGFVRKKYVPKAPPVLHISSKYSSKKNCIAVVAPIGVDHQRKTSIIFANLMEDPEPLLSLTSKQLREKLFNRKKDEEKIPLHMVNINKCPVFASVNALRKKDKKRLGIDLDLCFKNYESLRSSKDLANVAGDVYRFSYIEHHDPELLIYDRFLDDSDRSKLDEFRETDLKEIDRVKFNDDRMNKLAFRYKARNHQKKLSSDELKEWEKHRWMKLTNSIQLKPNEMSLTFETYFKELDEKLAEDISKDQKKILKKLKEYGKKLEKSFNKEIMAV